MAHLRRIATMRGTPEGIALGIALGVFIAFTPTVGFQIVIAASIATLMKANRTAAIIMVWITNPLTIPPIYTATYRVGTLLWPGRSVTHVNEMLVEISGTIKQYQFYEMLETFKEFLRIGLDLAIPMIIGGVIVGAIGAAISYPAALWGVRRYRRYHAARVQNRARRRAERLLRKAEKRAQRRDKDTPHSDTDAESNPVNPSGEN